ncbi:hypothetical protein HAX54_052797, partial [Datura stramonium]|nr:hypothetical protein [Datura stramonium]
KEFSEFEDQLKERKCRLDPDIGVKMKFVVELIKLCGGPNERVIIFIQLLDPLNLIKEQLSSLFGWTLGREILYMDGKLDVKQRQISINSLNDPRLEIFLGCEGHMLGHATEMLHEQHSNLNIAEKLLDKNPKEVDNLQHTEGCVRTGKPPSSPNQYDHVMQRFEQYVRNLDKGKKKGDNGRRKFIPGTCDDSESDPCCFSLGRRRHAGWVRDQADLMFVFHWGGGSFVTTGSGSGPTDLMLFHWERLAAGWGSGPGDLKYCFHIRRGESD